MNNPMVLIRCLTATVLFLLLAKVNIWTDTQTHLTLAVGYRALLLAAPVFLYFGTSVGMRTSLVIGVLALMGMFVSINILTVGLFALSVAVSGYICKFVNAQSLKGAADNKVSLNVGSLISGLLLMFIENKNMLLAISALALLATAYFSFKIDWDSLTSFKAIENLEKKQKPLKALPLIGWALIGIATGIKLTGVFTILPQYLLHKSGNLPFWFGSMIVLNSLGVIFFQHRILKFVASINYRWTLLFALSAMGLLALPEILSVESLPSAILWIVLLTLGECALSRYDKLANDEGYLFPKEVMVGVGSFATVFLCREYGNMIYLSGSIGFGCMLLGTFLATPRTNQQALAKLKLNNNALNSHCLILRQTKA